MLFEPEVTGKLTVKPQSAGQCCLFLAAFSKICETGAKASLCLSALKPSQKLVCKHSWKEIELFKGICHCLT